MVEMTVLGIIWWTSVCFSWNLGYITGRDDYAYGGKGIGNSKVNDRYKPGQKRSSSRRALVNLEHMRIPAGMVRKFKVVGWVE